MLLSFANRWAFTKMASIAYRAKATMEATALDPLNCSQDVHTLRPCIQPTAQIQYD